MIDRILRQCVMFFSVLLLAFAVHANHVRCECPNVNARATGNSSCSASESGGQCTVAFNEFDLHLELAAKDFLEKWSQLDNIAYVEFPDIRGSSDQRGFTLERAEQLWSRSSDALVDQIMIYALVAATEAGTYAGDEQSIVQLHHAMRENSAALGRIFVTGNTVFENDFVRINLGCFEFRIDDTWSMYKTDWSDSLGKSQC